MTGTRVEALPSEMLESKREKGREVRIVKFEDEGEEEGDATH